MRPVVYMGKDARETTTSLPSEGTTSPPLTLIGSFEQVYLDVACQPEDLDHLSAANNSNPPGSDNVLFREEDATDMLSVVANLTPFPDYNQSPRNMYQCQMGKQTMGTPTHSWPHRTDNRLYRLGCGQSPIVRPKDVFSKYGFEGYPNGTNAVVAVISYTGYDMEDAMILSKSSYERGFKHASVYKTLWYDLEDPDEYFAPISGKDQKRMCGKTVDEADGLPLVGMPIHPDDALLCITNGRTGVVRCERYKAFEDAYIDTVRLVGSEDGGGAGSNVPLPATLRRVCITFRIPRNPVIGDKFSSRHGQKGVCSQRWPTRDLPWSESGMSPDIIINPHAFPSRMTIGMFVESMAAKAGALHGRPQDGTPFRFTSTHNKKDNFTVDEGEEELNVVDYFGQQLKAAGFNYYGNEPMYSGTSGRLLRCDIYLGIVYYQRLRHMVSDKFQVRTTGPVHNLTQQPVKGRKRAGGIRMGEMERDSLLAHGAAFMLHDRLQTCSDASRALVCQRCESIMSPIPHFYSRTSSSIDNSSNNGNVSKGRCTSCGKSDAIDSITLPFVYRYLAAELMAMGVRMRIKVH